MKHRWRILFFLLLLCAVSVLILQLLVCSCNVSPHFNANEITRIIPVGDKNEFSFAVLGDNRGNYEIFGKIVGEINNLNPLPLFVVNTGDLITYGLGHEYESFVSFISKSKVPFLCIPGNHEYLLGGINHYKKCFGDLYYYFDVNNFRFIMLDNGKGEIGDEELLWFKKLLTQEKKIFVFMHEPPPLGEWVAHSFKGNATEFLKLAIPSNGVTAVFCGHIHGYSKKENNGVKYIITAGAGAPLRKMQGLESIYHYIIVTAKKNGEWSYEVKKLSKN